MVAAIATYTAGAPGISSVCTSKTIRRKRAAQPAGHTRRLARRVRSAGRGHESSSAVQARNQHTAKRTMMQCGETGKAGAVNEMQERQSGAACCANAMYPPRRIPSEAGGVGFRTFKGTCMRGGGHKSLSNPFLLSHDLTSRLACWDRRCPVHPLSPCSYASKEIQSSPSSGRSLATIQRQQRIR